MYQTTTFAIIVDGVVVNNIVVENQEKADKLKGIYGENAIAVESTLYPVGIGYNYQDGKFIDVNGNQVQRQATAQEMVKEAETINQKAKADMEYLSVMQDILLL